ncbi:MAG: penicillin-binding protein activator [Patescibacteria group bacterium]
MNNTTKTVIGIVVLALIVWGIAALTKSKNDAENSTEGQKIKVGLIAPLSGPVADYGEEIRKGAVAGAVEGVELVIEDEKCDPKEAVSAFQKLTDFQDIHFILGPECGSPQEAIVPLLKGKEIISMVSAAASSDLFAQSGGNFFNVQYSLQDESKYVAEKMYELGYRNVALVSYGNAFSQAHTDSFRKSFKGKIIFDTTIIDPASDVSTEVAKIKAAKVDAIYSPDISFFFASGAAKLEQYKVTAPVFSTYVAELPAVRTLVPNVYYSFPGDITGDQGAVYELSKQASAILTGAVVDCDGEYQCVKNKLVSSGLFNENGVYKRSIVLKQIKGGVPVDVK